MRRESEGSSWASRWRRSSVKASVSLGRWLVNIWQAVQRAFFALGQQQQSAVIHEWPGGHGTGSGPRNDVDVRKRGSSVKSGLALLSPRQHRQSDKRAVSLEKPGGDGEAGSC
jgi:hypothetical protein